MIKTESVRLQEVLQSAMEALEANSSVNSEVYISADFLKTLLKISDKNPEPEVAKGMRDFVMKEEIDDCEISENDLDDPSDANFRWSSSDRLEP